MENRRGWQTVQHGRVRKSLRTFQAQVLSAQYIYSTVAYKQAALNAIAYLMKVSKVSYSLSTLD
jgi:hypothetical protein